MHDTDKEWDKLHRDEIIVRWCCTIILAILFSLPVIGCVSVIGAPAPLPRVPKEDLAPTKPEVVGIWTYSWSGDGPGRLILRADGTIEEHYQGHIYFGDWHLRKWTVVITTWTADGDAQFFWGPIKLERKDGMLTGDRYSLKRVKGL